MMKELENLRKARNMQTGEVKLFTSDREVFNWCKDNLDWLSWSC